ncbi:MAG: hypothetical protein ACI31G_01620 [Bacilli bacterium]
MAKYIYINNLSKKGKLGISQSIFDSLVSSTLDRLEIKKASYNGRGNKVRLNKQIRTTIHKGIVHVWVAVDVPKKENIQTISKRIQDEIAVSFLACTDQVPFDVQVKVESLI